MGIVEKIVEITDLFEQWRAMGNRRLDNGIELIGQAGGEAEPYWMHVVFPGLSAAQVTSIEAGIGTPLPPQLRRIYRVIGGMTLFLGAFQLYGLRRPGLRSGVEALEPEDVVALNHEIDTMGWRPARAVAFAVNALDGSIHLTGMGRNPDEVFRCERATGRVLESHEDAFACVYDRLYRLDQLLLR
jgi:hypothetical protein